VEGTRFAFDCATFTGQMALPSSGVLSWHAGGLQQ
jgi:hypothetical protein